MTKERSEEREVRWLRNDVKDAIDHRIDYNNGFANLLRGNYSLFIALIALFISLYAARGEQELDLAPYYIPSLYLVIIIWLVYSTRNARGAIGKGCYIDLEEQKPTIEWHLRWAKPLYYSLWILALLCILLLLITFEKEWWMWAPAILFAILIPLIMGVDTTSAERTKDNKEKPKKMKKSWVIGFIVFLLILATALVYPYYRIVREVISIVLETPDMIIGIILTIFLIFVALASLSDYLSLKFTVANVFDQNYTLSLLREDVEEIDDREMLEEKREEVLKMYLPIAHSFLLLFHYHGLMFTRYTFEEVEEEEEEEEEGEEEEEEEWD